MTLVPIKCLVSFSRFGSCTQGALSLVPVGVVLAPLTSCNLTLYFASSPILLKAVVVIVNAPYTVGTLVARQLCSLGIGLTVTPFVAARVLCVLVLCPTFCLLMS